MNKITEEMRIGFLDSTEEIRMIISRHFHVDIPQLGDHIDTYLARYVGYLYTEESEKTYDLLSDALEKYQVTPLFRIENKQQIIYLIPVLAKKKPSNPLVNLLLFILTVFSVSVAGGFYNLEALPEAFDLALLWNLVKSGLPFSISMLGILVAHEFGHYFAGRLHKVHVSLPYFIPFPGSLIGTMGAFISMKEIPKNRKQLLDIGLAGPLAGLLIAIPVLFYGLRLSYLDALPLAAIPGQNLMLEGNSILYLALKYLAFGQLLPAPVDYAGVAPILYWVRYFFTGAPFPYGGLDVQINAIAWAGWAGLLVTSLNLVPAGQLDGGHLFYVLFGKEGAKRIYPWILITLIALGFFWSGWWFWAVLIFLFGRMHAEPLDQITPLDPIRKRLAWLGLIVFVFCFIPVPLLIV